MALMCDLRAVALSGSAQLLLALDCAGSRVESVALRNASGVNAVANMKVWERPYAAGPRTQIGATIASIAASGGAGRLDVKGAVQILEVEADQGSGGNVIDLAVTSGLLGDTA